MNSMIQKRMARGFWEERSTIRNRSRQLLQHHQDLVYFPKQEQPICFHPMVQSLGPAAEKYILIQSSFRFMASVFEHETKVVTDVVQKLAYGMLPLPEPMKQEMLSVVIDELYHGYVARDFIDQVAKATEVQPLPFAKESNMGRALDKAKREVSPPIRDLLSAVAVCIIENVITQELIGIDHDPQVNPFFYDVNRDHLADEGRHAGIFTDLITQIWPELEPTEKTQIQNAIPIFVKEWLNRDIAIADDILILRSLKLSEDHIAQVIYETHPTLTLSALSEVSPTVRHIEQWLRRVNVWDRCETLWGVNEAMMDTPPTDQIQPIGFLALSMFDEFGKTFESQCEKHAFGFKAAQIAPMFLTYLSHVLQKTSLTFLVVEKTDEIKKVVRNRTLGAFRVAAPDTLVRDLLSHWDDNMWLITPPRLRSPEDHPIPLEICFIDDKKPLINPVTLRIFFDDFYDSIEVAYHAGVYDSQRIAALLRDFLNYIKTISTSPLHDISSLPLVSHDSIFNGATHDQIHNTKTTILDALTQRAVEQPEQIALRSHDVWLTYEQLNLRISSLSHALVESDFSTGICVGIRVTNRFDFLCSLLGIMKAGCIAVPLPVDCTTRHLEGLVEQSQLKLILTDPEQKDSLNADIAQRMGIHVWPCQETLFKGAILHQSKADPDRLACILFTSGTSGAPKGVVLHHDEIARFGSGAKVVFPLLPSDVILQFSNLCFDASLAEIVNTISAGATLALPASDMMDSQNRFFEECQSLGVTVLNLPAAFWGQWACSPVDLPKNLRTILVYGEALSQDSLNEWYGKESKVSLINTYGPTEATIGASYCHLDQFKRLRHREQLIGRPFPGRMIYVLDPFQRPLPVGATGDIYVGGSGTRSFYLIDTQLIPVTDDHKHLGALYATGDLGQWLPCRDKGEHVLVFHGRNDHQVKIRGVRIELSAVEKAISTHPAVSDAIALVRKQENANSLDVFVLQRPGSDVSHSELRHYLSDTLTSHSCPSKICILQAWPLTERGKIDRSQLQKMSVESSIADCTENAWTNELTNELFDIWRKLLGVPKIGPKDHFFELGGHSLLAMTLVGRVNERWKVSLTLRRVIEHPRFDSMLRWLLSAVKQHTHVDDPSSVDLPSFVGPVSFGQQAILVADRLSTQGTPQYNVAFGLHFHESINEQALRSAVAFVLERQAALRCVFAWNNGRPKQKISTLSTVLEKEFIGYDAYLAWAEQNARTAHSLFEKPPIQVHLFQITDRTKTTILYFNLHHVIHDGLSIGILMREWMVSYDAFCCDQEPSLPTLKKSYLNFASYIRNRMDSNRNESLEFWRQYLTGSFPLVLECRKNHRGDLLQSVTHKITIDAGNLAHLRHRCRSRRINLSAALFAAIFYALQQRTLQEDYTFGTVVSLREEHVHEHLIGMFVHIVLLRSNLRFDASIEENVEAVHQSILSMLAHRHIPLSLLTEEINLPRDPHEHKVFDIMLNYHAFEDIFSASTSCSLHPELHFLDNTTVDVGLSMDIYDWSEQKLQIRLGYCRNLYDDDTIESLGRDLQKWIGIFATSDWKSAHIDHTWRTNGFYKRESLCQ